jgi:hypothetical protein
MSMIRKGPGRLADQLLESDDHRFGCKSTSAYRMPMKPRSTIFGSRYAARYGW